MNLEHPRRYQYVLLLGGVAVASSPVRAELEALLFLGLRLPAGEQQLESHYPRTIVELAGMSARARIVDTHAGREP